MLEFPSTCVFLSWAAVVFMSGLLWLTHALWWGGGVSLKRTKATSWSIKAMSLISSALCACLSLCVVCCLALIQTSFHRTAWFFPYLGRCLSRDVILLYRGQDWVGFSRLISVSICSLSAFVFTGVFTCSAVNSSDRLKQHDKKSSVLCPLGVYWENMESRKRNYLFHSKWCLFLSF